MNEGDFFSGCSFGRPIFLCTCSVRIVSELTWLCKNRIRIQKDSKVIGFVLVSVVLLRSDRL